MRAAILVVALAALLPLPAGASPCPPPRSFSELMDLYDAAESDEQREAALRALAYESPPETADFFRRLLFSGEPDWLIEPAANWFLSHGRTDLPAIEELATAYLTYPPGKRRPLLPLIWKVAERKDAPLLWTLLENADPGEIQEMVQWIAFQPWADSRIPLFAKLYRQSDERLRRELIRAWIRADSTPETFLSTLLVVGEQGPWEGSLERLVESFGMSTEPAERRKVLLQVVLRAHAEDYPVLWRLLRKAEAWEADLLVEWFDAHPLRSFEAMLGLYRSARTDEEKDRALWVAAVGSLDGKLNYDFLGRVLAAAGDLGEGPRRLHRLARAFHSCPNAESRSRMALQISNGVALAEDFPLVREMLRGSTVREARQLADWFSLHPSPEVIPDFRERLGAIHEDLWIPDALAAAGDPEILDWALKVLRRPRSDHGVQATDILSHSPLPAAAEEIRRILAEGSDSLHLLMVAFVDFDNASPYRWWFYEEILRSATLRPQFRPTAVAHLRLLAERGEETAKRLLAEAEP